MNFRIGLVRVFIVKTLLLLDSLTTGGSVLADTEALHLAATIPDDNMLGVWACQDMITAEIADGAGPRATKGHLHLPEQPGLGVHPQESTLTKVARYE